MAVTLSTSVNVNRTGTASGGMTAKVPPPTGTMNRKPTLPTKLI